MEEKTHVLYMEDNEGTARLLQSHLSRTGCTVDISPSGESGLELVATRHYDAVIVDYNLPGLNGLEIVKRLADQETTTPVIMLAGAGNERIAVDALKSGAFDYVVKDLDGVYLNHLPAVIKQGLEYSRLCEDKRRAEAALVESEKRFRSVIEESLDGIILVDEDGRIVEWNRAQAQITGIHREEALGQYIWDVSYQCLPEGKKADAARQLFKDRFQEFRQTREASWLGVPLEYDIERPDGVRLLIQSVKFLIAEDNRFLLVGITRDVTERKIMENALRESVEHFRILFELAPDAYYMTDLNGNLIDCNQVGETLIGYSRHEAIGKNMLEAGLVADVQSSKAAALLRQNVLGSATGPDEFTLHLKDREPVEVEVRTFPTQIHGTRVVLSIARDVTWRKKADARMKGYIQQLEILHRIDDELTRKLDTRYVQAMALDNMMRLSGANAGSIAVVGEGMVMGIHSVGYPEDYDQQYSLGKRSIVARVARRSIAEWIPDVSVDPDYFPALADTCSQITLPLVSQERLVGIVNLETNQPGFFDAEKFEFLKLVTARIAVAIDNAQLYDTRQRQLLKLQDLYKQISELEQLKTVRLQSVSDTRGQEIKETSPQFLS